MSIYRHFRRLPLLRDGLIRLVQWRIQEKLAAILPHLPRSARVLDVGTGNAILADRLVRAGHEVVGLDVRDDSLSACVKPVLYDGRSIPFSDGEFDVALCITVLHHVPDPDALLREIRRVARRILIIEEVYEGAFERYATYAIDSLFNMEVSGHPRSNRPDGGWRRAFAETGLKVVSARAWRSMVVLRRVLYVLEHESSNGG